MEVYRIVAEKYANKLHASGKPNRWNYENQFVVYAACSRSLAALELLANRNAIMEGLVYKVLTLTIPEDLNIPTLDDPKILIENWHLLSNRHYTQDYGSHWYIQKLSAVLKVPSALIPQEYNLIINTLHPDFSKIKIVNLQDFTWDRRLLK